MNWTPCRMLEPVLGNGRGWTAESPASPPNNRHLRFSYFIPRPVILTLKRIGLSHESRPLLKGTPGMWSGNNTNNNPLIHLLESKPCRCDPPVLPGRLQQGKGQGLGDSPPLHSRCFPPLLRTCLSRE